MGTVAAIAQDSTHWYDRAGNPVYTVKGAQDQDVTPDIRHARKLGLLPGVTGVQKVQAAPGLVNWLVDTALMAALTLPRIEGETLDQFKARARQDSQAQASNARDEGSSLHTALELFAQQRPYEARWQTQVEATHQRLLECGVDLVAGGAERSFAHPLGFGGKNDWHCRNQNVLLDYKSKPRIEDKKLVYDEHIQQLAACARGLMPADRWPRLLSVFVGIEDSGVYVHEWKPAEADRGWEMFKTALRLWQLKNNYDSSFSVEQQAA